MTTITNLDEYRARRAKRDRFAAVRALLESGRLVIPDGLQWLGQMQDGSDHLTIATRYAITGKRTS